MKKDDLISRAAAIAEIEQWAEHGYQTIHWTGIKAMLEVQPAVNAIPVEWIQAQVENEKRAPLFRRYAEALLTIWQNEQEAQDG